jgi:hypothetical protein
MIAASRTNDPGRTNIAEGRMSAAGMSAGTEARRHRALADEHTRRAAEESAASARYAVAEITEKRVARELSVLSTWGYHLLPDRAWPGSRSANVDLIVAGPAGVFIVDTKAWKDVSIHGGRIYRDQADVSDDLAHLADLARNTDGLLADIGLAPGEVHAVAVLAGRRGISEQVGPVEIIGEHDAARHILKRGERLSPNQVDDVVRLLLDHFPTIRPVTAVDATIPEPVLPAAPAPDLEPLFSVDEITSAALEGVLLEPIESWMSFLDPAQAKLARRSFNGPARIRGSAGTGKTVVGLHRAAYLARATGGRVLFATFTKSLPGVFANLLATMAPDVVGHVDFTGIHAFAMRILRERGIPAQIDAAGATRAFREAWSEHPVDSPLRSKAVTETYWRDEISHVIKGRGITRFEHYADLARVGRRHRLTFEHRKAVWGLYESYSKKLTERGVYDFADIILLARDSLRETPLTTYDAVIVDEAQDLSCAMVSFLHSLVGNRPDGLTLVGDGQQTIYPGGYTLAEIGISLAGRGVVLNVNHRNTKEILDFAATVIAGDEFTDIEGAGSQQDAVDEVTRTGPTPTIRHFPSRALHDAAVTARVRSALTRVGTSAGDIAVLASTTYQVKDLRRALETAGCRTIDLVDYDGTPTDAVKVGTIKRAKGLEFKHVLVARVAPDLLAPADAATELSDVNRERRDLDRRSLYVAMTRARDELWVGVAR